MIRDYSTEKFSQMAKAFSHIHRIDILKLLLEKNEVCCSTIVSKLPLAQSTVSQHLKILKEAGLIKGLIRGPSVLYSIDENSFDIFENSFRYLFKKKKEGASDILETSL